MTAQDRDERFVGSLRDWGCIFMLTVWLQSIMISAIAMKEVGSRRNGSIINPDGEYLERRNRLLKKDMSSVWAEFKEKFSANITKEEELVADMIILIRNQLAHGYISTGREFVLFLPRKSSQEILDRLKNAGWIETPTEGVSDPEMLILREGDKEWFAKNSAMITNFSEKTILRITRANGIDDTTIC